MVAAHLGITRPVALPTPATIPVDRPYFVTVGTIEPRKNHALLLDVWQRLGPDAPRLLICGARGWNNNAVFAALDSKPANVVELSGLTDSELAGVIKGAQALLFPSFAEGFGLPPLEALSLGTPVVCADLPVLTETIGANGIYLDPSNPSAWEMAVIALAGADRSQVQKEFTPPTWEAHFKIVFTMT